MFYNELHRLIVYLSQFKLLYLNKHKQYKLNLFEQEQVAKDPS